MRTIPLSASLLCLSVTAFAASLPRLPAKALSVKTNAEESVNFRISFKIKDGELENAGSFVVMSESQANYIIGGEKVVEVDMPSGKAVEFKKHGTIVNCLPVAKPDSALVRAECQFELSGPLGPVGTLKARPISTFQLQTSFEAALGRTLVLVDEPTRHLEVKVEVVAP